MESTWHVKRDPTDDNYDGVDIIPTISEKIQPVSVAETRRARDEGRVRRHVSVFLAGSLLPLPGASQRGSIHVSFPSLTPSYVVAGLTHIQSNSLICRNRSDTHSHQKFAAKLTRSSNVKM